MFLQACKRTTRPQPHRRIVAGAVAPPTTLYNYFRKGARGLSQLTKTNSFVPHRVARPKTTSPTFSVKHPPPPPIIRTSLRPKNNQMEGSGSIETGGITLTANDTEGTILSEGTDCQQQAQLQPPVSACPTASNPEGEPSFVSSENSNVFLSLQQAQSLSPATKKRVVQENTLNHDPTPIILPKQSAQVAKTFTQQPLKPTRPLASSSRPQSSRPITKPKSPTELPLTQPKFDFLFLYSPCSFPSSHRSHTSTTNTPSHSCRSSRQAAASDLPEAQTTSQPLLQRQCTPTTYFLCTSPKRHKPWQNKDLRFG